MIFHSDRGCQYTSQQFAALADQFGVRLSVGRTGQCWDNALAESFFATIKRELLGTAAWPSRAAARTAIFDFIERLVQLAPTAQQPRLPQPRRIRDRTRSLTTTPMVSVKAEQAHSTIRRELGKGPRPVATVIDSQSVKAASTVSKATRGYDAGKKINGRKRHVVVDTRGLPLMVMVTPTSLSDRDAAKEILFRLRLTHPEITIVWADSAYAGKLVTWAKQRLNFTIKPVSCPKDTTGFIVLSRR